MLYSKKYLLLFVTIGLLLVTCLPEIDQSVAYATYNAATDKFLGQENSLCTFMYEVINPITIGLILLPIICLFLSYFKWINFEFNQAKKFALIVLLSLAIGPGLLVNVVFKDHWGRNRPYQVLRHEGKYTNFWQPNFGNSEDNSFPSGHASIGFFLGVPFLALNKRRKAFIVGGIGGAMIGTVRILQGGHYVSDVIFAGIMVYLSAEFVIYITQQFKGSLSESK